MQEKLKNCDPEAMEKSVNSMHMYWETYKDLQGYQKFTYATFLQDALYGIGIAMDKEKYSFAGGFQQFKDDLLKVLTEEV